MDITLATRNLEQEAAQLIRHVTKGITSKYEGTWTLSVYDTAWISMVSLPNGDWLFPESFRFVLQQQQEDGSWPSYASESDGILNTLASLLAIEKHLEKETDALGATKLNIQQHKMRGLKRVQDALEQWSVKSCVHVGFEILIPALLSLLSGYGVELHFPAETALDIIYKEKMKKFSPEVLYGPHQSTLLHSLEAFAHTVDCSRLAHHKVGGSILGSPSATAAYLMYVPDWDYEAENYLRRCIENGGGSGLGGVPSAYPCEIFEFTWVCPPLRLLTPDH